MKRIGLFAACLAAAAVAAAAPPQTPTPAPPSADASAAEGKALFARVLEGLGGRDKIVKVRDVRTRGQVTAQAPSGEMSMEMETTMVFPDRLAQQVDAPFGRFSMAATPAGAFIQGSDGVRDLPPAMRDELLRQVRRTAFFLAQKADDPQFVAKQGGQEKIGEIRASILDISYLDVSVRWFVDPASGRILRSAHDSLGDGGKPVHVVSNFSDFKAVEGFSLPHHIEVSTEGSPDQTLVLEEIKINPGADPKLFEKPPAPTPHPTAKPAS